MDAILRDLRQLATDFASICDTKRDLLDISPAVSQKTLADKTALCNILGEIATAAADLASKCAHARTRAKESRDAERTTRDQLYAIAHGDAVWTTRESRYGPRDITIVPGVSLRAFCVRTFGDVKQDGSLYYIENANHFAFVVSGVMFHGNIGTVYTDEKQPIKIKNCAYGDTCVKKSHCDYYHDPAVHAGSKDIRNYMSGAPAARFGRPRARPSRATLAIDLTTITQEINTQNKESIMHDILCAFCTQKN